jgi:hypothetical protein
MAVGEMRLVVETNISHAFQHAILGFLRLVVSLYVFHKPIIQTRHAIAT